MRGAAGSVPLPDSQIRSRRRFFDAKGEKSDGDVLGVIPSTKFQPDLSFMPQLQGIIMRLSRPIPGRLRTLYLSRNRALTDASFLLAGAADFAEDPAESQTA